MQSRFPAICLLKIYFSFFGNMDNIEALGVPRLKTQGKCSKEVKADRRKSIKLLPGLTLSYLAYLALYSLH
jgi:hypothetical protein